MPKVNQISPIQAPVVISYRLEGKLLGKAPFYDAYTIAKHTSFQVSFIKTNHPEIKEKYLRDYVSSQTVNIPFAPMNTDIQRPVPTFNQAHEYGGLLVIPGMTRDSYEKNPVIHQQRIAFEKTIIADALRRGRPILGICAGSWTLWEALGGTLTPVTDHNYGGGMPRINANGKMTYNIHIHDVVIKEGGNLYMAMGYKSGQGDKVLPANSIHWMAPNAENVPNNYEVVATSQQNQNITLHTRQGTKMEPEAGSIEAFSSKHGALVMGILWHPEAFDFDKNAGADQRNSNALLFMAKAGTAYQNKQKMLKELQEKAAQAQSDDVDHLDSIFKKMAI